MTYRLCFSLPQPRIGNFECLEIWAQKGSEYNIFAERTGLGNVLRYFRWTWPDCV